MPLHRVELFQQFASVCLVLGLTGLAAWWLRKGRLPGSVGSLSRGNYIKRMQLVQRLPLTPQHHLCVVRLDGVEWVLGVYPSGMKVIQRGTNSMPTKPVSPETEGST